MSDTTETVEPAAEPNGDQQATVEEVDYKAKYEATLAHSREWERKAKANKDAAEKLQQLEDAQKSESQKMADKLAALERENAEFKQRDQLAQWTAEVAKDAPELAHLLRGSTREELEDHFNQLRSLTKKPTPKAVPSGDAPADRVKPSSAVEALRAMRKG